MSGWDGDGESRERGPDAGGTSARRVDRAETPRGARRTRARGRETRVWAPRLGRLGSAARGKPRRKAANGGEGGPTWRRYARLTMAACARARGGARGVRRGARVALREVRATEAPTLTFLKKSTHPGASHMVQSRAPHGRAPVERRSLHPGANHGSSTARRESPGGVGFVAAVATCASLILQAVRDGSLPAPRSHLTPRALVVVVVVLEVRGVAVDERVPVLVESIEDPEPGEAAEAVRPRLVERPGLVQGQALVRDAGAAAACAEIRFGARGG